MASYNKRISDQSKVKFNPINRELEDSENSELDSRVDNLEENILDSKTATGNPITITDAAPVNAVNLSMNLEPIQAGSGTPSPDNIRPISGRSEVAINRVGKNKLPMTLDEMKASNTTGTWSGNTYTINGGTITVSTDDGGNVTAITVNGTFNAITEFRLTNPSNLNNNFYGYVLNGSPTYPNRDIALLVTYIEGGAWKGEQFSYNEEDTTINQSFATIIFSIYVNASTSVTDKVFKPMLRLSTETDPTYEPYKGKTYTIQLGDTVYGGTLDVTRGKMVVDKALKTLTSGGVKYGSTSVIYSNTVTDGLTDGACISNIDKTEGSAPKVKISNGAIIWDGAFVRLGISTIEEFNIWNTSNPLQVCYELATPFTIDLTPQQIKLLENTNTLYTDYEGDTITIEYRLNNAIGEILGEVDDIYNKIDDIYNKIESLDTRVTALEES